MGGVLGVHNSLRAIGETHTITVLVHVLAGDRIITIHRVSESEEPNGVKTILLPGPISVPVQSDGSHAFACEKAAQHTLIFPSPSVSGDG